MVPRVLGGSPQGTNVVPVTETRTERGPNGPKMAQVLPRGGGVLVRGWGWGLCWDGMVPPPNPHTQRSAGRGNHNPFSLPSVSQPPAYLNPHPPAYPNPPPVRIWTLSRSGTGLSRRACCGGSTCPKTEAEPSVPTPHCPSSTKFHRRLREVREVHILKRPEAPEDTKMLVTILDPEGAEPISLEQDLCAAPDP